jgi:hypothetical protein
MDKDIDDVSLSSIGEGEETQTTKSNLGGIEGTAGSISE